MWCWVIPLTGTFIAYSLRTPLELNLITGVGLKTKPVRTSTQATNFQTGSDLERCEVTAILGMLAVSPRSGGRLIASVSLTMLG